MPPAAICKSRQGTESGVGRLESKAHSRPWCNLLTICGMTGHLCLTVIPSSPQYYILSTLSAKCPFSTALQPCMTSGTFLRWQIQSLKPPGPSPASLLIWFISTDLRGKGTPTSQHSPILQRPLTGLGECPGLGATCDCLGNTLINHHCFSPYCTYNFPWEDPHHTLIPLSLGLKALSFGWEPSS